MHQGWGSSQPLFRTSFLPATTPSFDNGHKFPATEGARWCYLNFECVHRGFESCEGDLKHHTRQGCFWFRRRDLNDDWSMFLPILRDGELTVHLLLGLFG